MWIIIKDIIDDGEAEGRKSSDHVDGVELSHHFRLLDGDGEPYYEGLSNDKDTHGAFSPLDDFGTPNAGCTEIQYLQVDGEWEPL